MKYRQMTGRAPAALSLVMVFSVGAFAGLSKAVEPSVKVTDASFKCITEMTKVRHFYVDNLRGAAALKQTVAVAEAGRGDYPEGSQSRVAGL